MTRQIEIIDHLNDADRKLLLTWHRHLAPAAKGVSQICREEALERLFSKRVLERSVSLGARSGGQMLAALVTTAVCGEFDDESMDGILHCLVFEPGSSCNCIGPLLSALAVTARRERWTFLRSRLPLWSRPILTAEDWQFKYISVRKVLSGDALPAPIGPATVRRATRRDLAFVVGLLREGIAKAMAPAERGLFGENLADIACRCLSLYSRDDAYIAVAEIEGLPVGYALANIANFNEQTAMYEAIIHDVFVLPSYGALGIGHQLTYAVEHVARECGVAALCGTVTGPVVQGADMILAKICLEGWEPTDISFCRSLKRQ